MFSYFHKTVGWIDQAFVHSCVIDNSLHGDKHKSASFRQAERHRPALCQADGLLCRGVRALSTVGALRPDARGAGLAGWPWMGALVRAATVRLPGAPPLGAAYVWQ